MIALESVPGGLRLTTPYDAAFLAAFKQAIPYNARTWQKPYWIIAPAYAAQVASLVQSYFGVALAQPVVPQPNTVEVRAVEMHYLGQCKERGDGQISAYGYADGAWTLIFAESVLRAWFGAQDQKPNELPTLYATLGIPSAVAEDEIKRAYRRMARQWHPDVCKEPDARDRFEQIRHAYDILGDAVMRRKYDAGLALQASLTQQHDTQFDNPYYRPPAYRAPLRCGYLLMEGRYEIGRFLVARILDWQDIVRNGKTMVSSWDSDNEKIRTEWV